MSQNAYNDDISKFASPAATLVGWGGRNGIGGAAAVSVPKDHFLGVFGFRRPPNPLE